MESLAPRATDALINRRQELAWLEFSLVQAAAGRPRAVLSTGDAGVGKSRLTREVMKLASSTLLVGAGRGHEGSVVPYLPFAESLEALCESARAASVALPDGVPALLGSAAAARAGSSPVADAERAAFLLSVSRFVLALARRRPILLALDDVHWFDQASLDLLSHLVGAIADAQLRGPMPIMLLLSSRPIDAATRAGAVCARLLREEVSEQLELAGLDAADTMNLIAAHGLAKPSQALTSAIFELTSGNPLFVQALVRQLLARGVIRYVDGFAIAGTELSELRLPLSLTAALAAQAQALAPSCREALEYAALIGLRFALDAVAELSGQEPEQLAASFDAVPGLVRRARADFEFVHPLARQVFIERMQSALARERHARIAQLLARASQVGDERGEWTVAAHLIAAGSAADPTQLFEYASRAGDRALGVHGFGEAASAYSAAAAAASSSEERARLHYLAGLCHARNADQGPSAEHYAAALAEYRALGDREGVARVLAESARNELYRLPVGKLRDLRAFEAALEALGDDAPVVRGALLSRIADAYFYARRPREGEDFARRALDCGIEAEDHALCRDACIPLALNQQQALRFREAKATFALGLRHAEALADLWSESAPRVRYAGVLHMLGEIADGIREAERARDSAERTNNAAELAVAHAELAQLKASLGDFTAVSEHVQEVLRVRARLKAPWAVVTGVPALAYARFLRGEWQAAEDALATLDGPGVLLEQGGGAFHVMSVVYRDLVRATAGLEPEHGFPEQKERLLRYAERAARGAAEGGAIAIAAALVELAQLHAVPAATDALVPLLLRAEEAGVVLGQGWPLLTARALALAALARDERAQARRWFEQALRAAEASGALCELARTELDYARFLSADGNEASDARARELLAHASPAFERLQMAPWLRRTKQLAAALGLRVGGESAPGLGPLDRQLLRGLTQERGASALADELLLRPTTLTGQVDALYERLGVSGRMEAAAFAVSQGIAGQEPPKGVPLILMVTDLEGFTQLLEQLGDAAAQRLIRLHNRILRSCVRDCGGTEITHTGDGIIAAFRSVREAVTSAIAIQSGFDEYNRGKPERPMRVRIGLHGGEPLPEEGRLFGVAVNATVRICAVCGPGHILASGVVLEGAGLLRTRFSPRGPHSLKGLARSIELFEIAWQDSALAAASGAEPERRS